LVKVRAEVHRTPAVIIGWLSFSSIEA